MDLRRIRNHFKLVDPIIYEVLRKVDFGKWLTPRKESEYFVSLCREIIGQQLSDKASAKIIERFMDLFSNGKVTPETIERLTEEKLRQAGMAWSKARYLKNLARAVIDRQVHFNIIKNYSDERVVEELTRVKGIGPWTAEMFLIFTLGREDVFSFGDLGLRRAIEKLYQVKNPSADQLEKITAPWSPYRTYGSIVLWQSLEDK